MLNEHERRRERQRGPSPLREGNVSAPPFDADGFVRVELDGEQGVTHACPWSPRDGAVPQAGDAVAVIESDAGNYWVVAWWPANAAAAQAGYLSVEYEATAVPGSGAVEPLLPEGGATWVGAEAFTFEVVDGVLFPAPGLYSVTAYIGSDDAPGEDLSGFALRTLGGTYTGQTYLRAATRGDALSFELARHVLIESTPGSDLIALSVVNGEPTPSTLTVYAGMSIARLS